MTSFPILEIVLKLLPQTGNISEMVRRQYAYISYIQICGVIHTAAAEPVISEKMAAAHVEKQLIKCTRRVQSNIVLSQSPLSDIHPIRLRFRKVTYPEIVCISIKTKKKLT